jgi:quinol monooxygenase YgiN
MISFTVRMTFRSEDREEIARILRELAVLSRQEPGCVSYIPHLVESDPDTIVIYEQYRDQAALEHHRGTPHFGQFAIGGLYQKMLERWVENLTALA